MNRRRRRCLVALCLIALVWCQTAMAAQWCHGMANDDAAMTDCHGRKVDSDTGPSTTCPGQQLVPDLGKLPAVPALLPGHDYVATALPAAIRLSPRPVPPAIDDGPPLATSCRLLI